MAMLLGSPCEPLHSHADICHCERFVAFTGLLPVVERHNRML